MEPKKVDSGSSSTPNLVAIENKKHLFRTRFDLDNFDKPIFLYFYAEWHE